MDSDTPLPKNFPRRSLIIEALFSRALGLNFHFCDWQNKFIFNVGYHELEGSKATLKKPLVIMTKKKVGEDTMEVDWSESYGQGSSDVAMEVVGIIRHKLLFKNRPKALISSKSMFSTSLFASLLIE